MLTPPLQFAFHALKIKDALQDVIGGDHLNIRNKVRNQDNFDTGAERN